MWWVLRSRLVLHDRKGWLMCRQALLCLVVECMVLLCWWLRCRTLCMLLLDSGRRCPGGCSTWPRTRAVWLRELLPLQV